VNVTLFYNTAVTSRLLPITGASNVSEALLLIDEPGSGVASYYGTANDAPGNPQFGSAAGQILCGTGSSATNVLTGQGQNATTGCVAFSKVITPANGPFAGTPITVSSATPTAITTAANVYQGIVSGNQIQFFGIPFLAPVTTGASRTLRITNARVNATSLGGGSAAGATPVVASISISGATSLSISNATPTVGFVQGGLSASASGATNLN
jgi:hypothetical protein